MPTKPTTVKISTLKPNPGNPRLIRDEKFQRLVQSIKDFPEMLELRPIIINAKNVILGGNMRFRAAKEAGLKEVPVIVAKLSPKQEQEFIVKDNVGFGEWDWDIIANNFDPKKIEEWGLEVPDLFDQDKLELVQFFKGDDTTKKDAKTLTLIFADAKTCNSVKAKLKKIDEKPEQALLKLLK